MREKFLRSHLRPACVIARATMELVRQPSPHHGGQHRVNHPRKVHPRSMHFRLVDAGSTLAPTVRPENNRVTTVGRVNVVKDTVDEEVAMKPRFECHRLFASARRREIDRRPCYWQTNEGLVIPAFWFLGDHSKGDAAIAVIVDTMTRDFKLSIWPKKNFLFVCVGAHISQRCKRGAAFRDANVKKSRNAIAGPVPHVQEIFGDVVVIRRR